MGGVGRERLTEPTESRSPPSQAEEARSLRLRYYAGPSVGLVESNQARRYLREAPHNAWSKPGPSDRGSE